MARYIQQDAAGAARVRPGKWTSWKVIVPVDKRPKKKMNNLNLENLFSVTCATPAKSRADRRQHQKIVGILNTGYAVHLAHVGFRAATCS